MNNNISKEFISYGKQWIDEEDISAVVSTLRSDYLTQGPAVSAFEEALCRYTGAKYCVAVANATAGLHMAAAALEIMPGLEGITSPNTFVASSNCLIYNGLKPVFADIEPLSLNIDPRKIEEKINAQTRVLIPVHFAGRPCKMPEIKKLAAQHNLSIIEDAAHAIGSAYPDGSKVGSCRYSEMTVFSFHPVKTLTTGEGGAITTNSPELYQKLLLLRSHGITREPGSLKENPGPWYYEMQALGFNFRLTDIQAALGSSQLARLDAFKARRKEIFNAYQAAFASLPWLKTPAPDEADSCFHLYPVQIDFKALGLSRAEVMNRLKAAQIGTQVHYIPVHTQPYYQTHYHTRPGDCPHAEAYYEKALSLPLYPKMIQSQINHVVDSLRGLDG